MRQYGCPHGNPWDSERDIRAAKARAVEDRLAQEEIKEEIISDNWYIDWLDSEQNEADDPYRYLCEGRDIFLDKQIYGFFPKTCNDS